VTLLFIDEVLSEEEALAQYANPTVKCGWCGEMIKLSGDDLALAMCQPCYDGMLAEFLRQQASQQDQHASDR
jgi:hypothetical protein